MADMKASLKEKLVQEMKEMLVIFLYLALFFCTFTTYRRLVMREVGVSYFHYGFALLKALVLAKVVLLGQYARLGKIFDDRPLIVPTLYKVVLFSLFTLVFEILEHAVGGLLDGKAMRDALREISGVGRDELLARTLTVLSAFIPFFAFTETGRRLGEGKLSEMFFKKGHRQGPAGKRQA